MLPLVNQIACTRDVALEKARLIERGEYKILIGFGEPEGEAMRRELAPVMQRVLRERIARLDAQLAEHGVEIG